MIKMWSPCVLIDEMLADCIHSYGRTALESKFIDIIPAISKPINPTKLKVRGPILLACNGLWLCPEI